MDPMWCYWCDRPRVDCACHLDPNGLPPGHWSVDDGEIAAGSPSAVVQFIQQEREAGR